MKTMNQLLLVISLALIASSAAYAQQAPLTTGDQTTARGIVTLEREYDQAYVRADAKALERLQTSDFRMTARGRVMTGTELLARLKDTSHPRDVIESLTTDDVQVRVYGDTAVTTGHWKRVSKNAEGKDTSAEGFFTRVWVKQNGTWLMSVAHYSPIIAPAK